MVQMKAQIMDDAAVFRALMRIAHEIEERNSSCSELCLVGICRRGVPLAQQIAQNIRSFSKIKIYVGGLDISNHRDDGRAARKISGTEMNFSVEGRTVVLVDDVICTGRTVRAAMDALMEHGRPACIQLAVLIDRGHRELPIRADFIGKNVPTSREEKVVVAVKEVDGQDQVVIAEEDGR